MAEWLLDSRLTFVFESEAKKISPRDLRRLDSNMNDLNIISVLHREIADQKVDLWFSWIPYLILNGAQRPKANIVTWTDLEFQV